MQLFFPFLVFNSMHLMAPTIFVEKDFSRILTDVNQCDHVFIDRIRERNFYTLVYDNTDFNSFYCPDLVKQFYTSIDASTINLDLNQFVVRFDTGDLLVTIDTIAEVTQIPSLPQHTAPLPLLTT